jgi:CBS domain-containing protein
MAPRSSTSVATGKNVSSCSRSLVCTVSDSPSPLWWLARPTIVRTSSGTRLPRSPCCLERRVVVNGEASSGRWDARVRHRQRPSIDTRGETGSTQSRSSCSSDVTTLQDCLEGRALMAKSIKDAMTTKPASLPATSTLADAAQRMRDLDIGDVLIEEGGRLTGIVTDRDLVVRAMAEGRDITSKLGDVVSSEVVCIAPTDTADDAIRLMRGTCAAAGAGGRERQAHRNRVARRSGRRTRSSLAAGRDQQRTAEPLVRAVQGSETLRIR